MILAAVSLPKLAALLAAVLSLGLMTIIALYRS